MAATRKKGSATRQALAVVEPVALGPVPVDYEGASPYVREMVSWRPTSRPADVVINPSKSLADARTRDSARNIGVVQGANNTHRDSIVGAQYRLTAQPILSVLNTVTSKRTDVFDDVWEQEFQEAVEDRFNLSADCNSNWLDRMGVNNLTALVRLAVGGFMLSGEVLATAEWDRTAGRPFNTCVQMISPDRLCNPNFGLDTDTLRRGVVRDVGGRALSYWIQKGNAVSLFATSDSWQNVPAMKPWGRQQVIHIIEQQQPDQSRGIADMVSGLKDLRMMKKFKDTTLQSAVISASYAAAIESELPPEVVAAAMGASPGGGPANGMLAFYSTYMSALAGYSEGGKNISIDGAMVPQLFPNTKLNIKPVGTPGGVGTGFEISLLRHLATALGISYEELSRDYSQTNYSSLRATLSQTNKFMSSRKKHVADRFAGDIYALWFEEQMADGYIPLPAGIKRSIFYQPLAKEAFTSAEWIGAGFGQIDEMKETQAALMRIGGGLSTLERECGRLGLDYRKVLKQLSREKDIVKKAGLNLSYDATKATVTGQGIISGGVENDAGPAQPNGGNAGG